MLARSVRATFNGALVSEAAFALEKELDALAAALLALW
jgi:hypothetical protein